MRLPREANTEPIPGYRLIEPLGSGGFGEVWKCEAPGGLFKAIKFVNGSLDDIDGQSSSVEQELQSLQHIKTIRHPFILSLDRVEIIDGQLLIVMELADRSLHDLLVECQNAGKPGIPRGQLLGYLREAAEALDVISQQYKLQHLDVKPQNLFVVSNHVKVADFGLVNRLAERKGTDSSRGKLAPMTPLYAAPESYRGLISPHSDQYSLAIVYHELLTGRFPFQGKNSRQLAMQHVLNEPDLGRLPECDRSAAARALAKEPEQRFPSCSEFVQALALAGAPVSSTSRTDHAGSRELLPFEIPTREMHLDKSLSSSESAGTPVGTEHAAATVASESLAGYEFRACLARGPLSETWEASAPGGRSCMVQLVHGFGRDDPRLEREAVTRLRSLRNPALWPVEVLQADANRLALVMDLAPETLLGRFQQGWANRREGIPRQDLLDCLQEAAAALDSLYQQYEMQHLGLHPGNLLLDNERVFLTEFGLAELLWLPAGQPVTQFNPRYVAPELLMREIAPGCDQYSLALIFVEMLTGRHPVRVQNRRPTAGARVRSKPDLSLLTGADQAVVARALHIDPQERFASCTEMVAALEAANANPKAKVPLASSSGELRVLPVCRTVVTDPGVLRQNVSDLLLAAAGPVRFLQSDARLRYVLQPDGTIAHHCVARLYRGALGLKLDGFRQQWKAEVVQAKETSYIFRVNVAVSLWRKCLGHQPALEIDIGLLRADSSLSEILVRIRPLGCGKEEGDRLLEEWGPQLLKSVRTCLHANPERRGKDRLLFDQPLQVCSVLPTLVLGEAFPCQGKDVSWNGMGFYAPFRPDTSQIHIRLALPDQPSEIVLPAQVVRIQSRGDGRYEIGSRFALDGPNTWSG